MVFYKPNVGYLQNRVSALKISSQQQSIVHTIIYIPVSVICKQTKVTPPAKQQYITEYNGWLSWKLTSAWWKFSKEDTYSRSAIVAGCVSAVFVRLVFYCLLNNCFLYFKIFYVDFMNNFVSQELLQKAIFCIICYSHFIYSYGSIKWKIVNNNLK